MQIKQGVKIPFLNVDMADFIDSEIEKNNEKKKQRNALKQRQKNTLSLKQGLVDRYGRPLSSSPNPPRFEGTASEAPTLTWDEVLQALKDYMSASETENNWVTAIKTNQGLLFQSRYNQNQKENNQIGTGWNPF